MRLDDWEPRLVAAIQRHQAMPFEWGVSDCARFIGDCIAAQVGADPMAPFGPWHDQRSAMAALRASGHATVPDFLGARFEEIEPGDVLRGDLALPFVDGQPLTSPAIVLGGEMLNRDETRWVLMHVSKTVRAWRVA